MNHELIGKIAGIFGFIGFLPYVISIVKGNVPSKASWILWALMGIVIGLSYWTSGASSTVWVPLSYAIGPLAVLCAIFLMDRKHQSESWPRVDKIFFAVGIICFLPWTLFKLMEFNSFLPAWSYMLPLTTLYGGIIVDGLGAIPTIIKSYRHPASENLFAWTCWGIGNILNLFALDSWSLHVSAYVIYMAIPSSCIVPSLIYWQFSSKANN